MSARSNEGVVFCFDLEIFISLPYHHNMKKPTIYLYCITDLNVFDEIGIIAGK